MPGHVDRRALREAVRPRSATRPTAVNSGKSG